VQLYTVLLVEDSKSSRLKTANRGRAQYMLLPVNEIELGFCKEIKELPVALKLESVAIAVGT
jgi:hypothetical protein